MVYFKLSKALSDLVRASKMQNLVGCQVYCDRQYISFADLEQVVLKLRGLHAKVRAVIEKRAEEKKRLEEEKDPERRKVLEYMIKTQGARVNNGDGNLETMSDEDLKKKLKEYSKWESLDLKQITAEAEIIFMDQHYCNNNLRKKGTPASSAA